MLPFQPPTCRRFTPMHNSFAPDEILRSLPFYHLSLFVDDEHRAVKPRVLCGDIQLRILLFNVADNILEDWMDISIDFQMRIFWMNLDKFIVCQCAMLFHDFD